MRKSEDDVSPGSVRAFYLLLISCALTAFYFRNAIWFHLTHL